MNCPVCQHTGVGRNDEICSQCGSEIGIFKLINKGKSQRNKFRGLSRIMLLLTLLFASGWLISYLNAASDVDKGKVIQSDRDEENVKKDAQIKELIKQLNDREVAIAELNEKLHLNSESIHKTDDANDSEIFHIVKSGETLWDIAIEHFGTGFKHEKIARDNQLRSSDDVKQGDTLIIKK